MTWYPAYLDSKQDIVDFVTGQRPGMTTGHVLDVDVRLADIAIFSYLYENGRIKIDYTGTVSGNTPDPVDRMGLLWGASLAYNCEFLSYRGVINFNVGGVQEVRAGELVKKFMRMQPMFFMRNTTQGLHRLMPFRTFKQIAQNFLDAYISYYHNEVSGVKGMQPFHAQDWSSRGWGANANLNDYMALDDAELTGNSVST